MVDIGVAMAMMAVLLVTYRVAPGWSLVLLPVWMTLLAMLALGVGLCTAALTVSYRDVQFILPVFTQILLYASPVAYSVNYVLERLSPGWRPFYLLNPLAGPLEAFRWSLLNTSPPPMYAILFSVAVSIVLFGAGTLCFKRMERRFSDVI
jgi:lipopolysaccharide transport system permease protein